jgi:hypothetical protein
MTVARKVAVFSAGVLAGAVLAGGASLATAHDSTPVAQSSYYTATEDQALDATDAWVRRWLKNHRAPQLYGVKDPYWVSDMGDGDDDAVAFYCPFLNCGTVERAPGDVHTVGLGETGYSDAYTYDVIALHNRVANYFSVHALSTIMHERLHGATKRIRLNRQRDEGLTELVAVDETNKARGRFFRRPAKWVPKAEIQAYAACAYAWRTVSAQATRSRHADSRRAQALRKKWLLKRAPTWANRAADIEGCNPSFSWN